MAAITLQQLENAAADAQTLSDVVNGGPSPGLVTSRLGQLVKTVSKAVLDLLSFQGAWSGVTTYQLGHIVTYDGSGYLCIQANNTNHLPTDVSWWALLVSKGDQGIQGVQGIQGPPGSINAIGSNLDFTNTYKCTNLAAPSAANDSMRYGDSFAKQGTPSTLSYNTNWSDGSSGVPLRYWKDRNGIVRIEGYAQAAAGAGTTIAFLPVGYRPENGMYFPIYNITDGTITQISVTTAGGGALQISGPPIGKLLALDSIQFRWFA